MVKQFLTENGIVFEDIDVSVNQAAAQEMVKRSGQMGVPVLDIDGQMVVGFDKGKIKQLLKL
jgi:glutaredoxin